MAHMAKREDPGARGSWFYVADEETGAIAVRMFCPICNTVISLSCYAIHRSGLVLSPVECPFPGCHFYENVILENWTG